MNWKNYLNVSSDKPVIPFIVGPTASGKTAYGIDLAKEIDGEIISADSMQIYKHMDIGTAKPTPEEQAEIPHHLIDFVEPDQPYSVADFYNDATLKINDILSRGKTPVIVGGTGLYVNSLSYPFNLNVDSTDENIRSELEALSLTEEGKNYLYSQLQKIDPESALKIHPNNIKRVIRALEIYQVTGKTKSQLDREGQNRELEYTPILLSPSINRADLYDKINKRIDIMMENGLLEEVINLEKKYGRSPISMQALGYKEFFDYLDQKISLDEAVEILKRDTRHFAKRQLTWFRKDDRIIYFNP